MFHFLVKILLTMRSYWRSSLQIETYVM